MKTVQPGAYIIGETFCNLDGIHEMLMALGMTVYQASDWMDNNSPAVGECAHGEFLVEVAGRLCYKSFLPGMNANVTKVREGNQKYIANILKSKHGSVLEHVHVSVAFTNVSRVFTHEIVRHRAGCAFSQESLRYVRLDNLGCRAPSIFDNDTFLQSIYDQLGYGVSAVGMDFTDWKGRVQEEVQDAFVKAFTTSEACYKALCEIFEIDNLKDFEQKKALTSAFRRVAPIGLTTNIIVTANHRAWRHMIELRTGPGVEEEMIDVIGMVAAQMKNRYANIYQDMEHVDASWKFANSKI